jgi:hypothetical protein
MLLLATASLCIAGTTAPSVVGDYIQGGTGEWGATNLTLAADRTYVAVHTACFGADGEERGIWSLSGGTVALQKTSHSGHEPLLGSLHIESRRESFILVAHRDLARHRDRPSDEYTYFRPSTTPSQ